MTKKIKITYLRGATKFLKKNSSVITENEVDMLIIKFVKKRFFGADINIDYKQMSGKLKSFYRIRRGKIRIIVEVVDDEIIIETIINDIGFRGDIYK